MDKNLKRKKRKRSNSKSEEEVKREIDINLENMIDDLIIKTAARKKKKQRSNSIEIKTEEKITIKPEIDEKTEARKIKKKLSIKSDEKVIGVEEEIMEKTESKKKKKKRSNSIEIKTEEKIIIKQEIDENDEKTEARKKKKKRSIKSDEKVIGVEEEIEEKTESKKKKKKRSNSGEFKSPEDKQQIDENPIEDSIIEIDTSLYRNKNDIKSIKDVTNINLRKAIAQRNNELEQMFKNNKHLMDLRIKIPFEVPKAHQIDRTFLDLQTPRLKRLFQEIPINTKKFTKHEDDLILNNFKEFCEVHKIKHDPAPFLHFFVNRRYLLNVHERSQFVRYIGRGLGDRKLLTIYKRFRLLNSKNNKGRFSTIEDQILLTYMEKNNDNKRKFAEIAKILNRENTQILKRYFSLTESSNYDFGKISGILKVETLVSTMMDVLNISTVDELKKTELNNEFWEAISKKLDDYPIYQLRRFWNLSVATKLFNPNVKVNKVMRKVIDGLDKKNITDWKSIDWVEVSKPFERKYYTAPFIYDKFKDLKKCNVPREHHPHPNVCIKMLNDLYKDNPYLLNKIQSYKYEDGKITKSQ